MRVAYFTESLYPHVDGVSRTLARLFATLQRREIDFQVYSPFVPGRDVSWAGNVIPVRYVRFPPYPDYRITLPITRRIRRHLADYRPDLVHVVSPTPMAYRAQSLAEELEIPVVASFHTHFVSYFRYYGIPRLESVGWRLLRAFYRRCARVYVPSPSVVRELATHGITGLELWSRGVDLDRFSPEFRNPPIIPGGPEGGDGPVLLMVSRLVREKDLGDLIEVDRILRSRRVRFRFVLVGDGPMRGELEAALPHAHFAGHASGHELARWYASADVFVFPSTTETLGNVVLEALASGLPAVVVDRGGPRDLIAHGETGYIAKANEPADIARHLQRLLTDETLRHRMGRTARATAQALDWERINDGLIESYRTVVATHGTGVRAIGSA